jgi:hypothetical protein
MYLQILGIYCHVQVEPIWCLGRVCIHSPYEPFNKLTDVTLMMNAKNYHDFARVWTSDPWNHKQAHYQLSYTDSLCFIVYNMENFQSYLYFPPFHWIMRFQIPNESIFAPKFSTLFFIVIFGMLDFWRDKHQKMFEKNMQICLGLI